MAIDLNGIVDWLKGWFYDKSEITSKEQALQTQINNKANTSDLNTTNGNVTNLQNNKADKANGASQITDSAAHSNIGTSSGVNQSAINTAIDSAIGSLKSIKVVEVVSSKPTPSADTLGKLYIVNEDNKINVYYTKQTGTGSSATYSLEKMDSDILDELVVNWSDIQNKPSTFTPTNHNHGNIINDGKLTVDASAIKKAVVTDNEDNISVVSVDKLNCGTFAELQALINASSGNVISLDKDYKNDGSESEIKINRSITIIGNGHVIDGNNTSRIFNITSDKLVKCVGIYFINGNSAGNGGAIRCDNVCSFFDCKFYNNTALGNGGGLYCTSNNIIVNCLFYGNKGQHGGGIHNAFSNTIISNCMFLYNSASGSGGGLITDLNNTIIECIFKNNTCTYYGNAINSSTNGLIVYNCHVNATDLYNTINKDYLTDHQSLSGYLQEGDAITSIVKVPKSEDSTGALRLYFGDEPSGD